MNAALDAGSRRANSRGRRGKHRRPCPSVLLSILRQRCSTSRRSSGTGAWGAFAHTHTYMYRKKVDKLLAALSLFITPPAGVRIGEARRRIKKRWTIDCKYFGAAQTITIPMGRRVKEASASPLSSLCPRASGTVH